MLLAGDTDAATTAADKPLRHSSEATLSSTAWDAPVPLTQGLYGHLGNSGPLAGAELQADLMNGLYFVRGSRYEISALNLAVLRDLGLPIVPDAVSAVVSATVSEPGSRLLALLALAMLLTARQRARKFS